jgi:hypothetical protein
VLAVTTRSSVSSHPASIALASRLRFIPSIAGIDKKSIAFHSGLRYAVLLLCVDGVYGTERVPYHSEELGLVTAVSEDLARSALLLSYLCTG